jgi:hypothetical protein
LLISYHPVSLGNSINIGTGRFGRGSFALNFIPGKRPPPVGGFCRSELSGHVADGLGISIKFLVDLSVAVWQ